VHYQADPRHHHRPGNAQAPVPSANPALRIPEPASRRCCTNKTNCSIGPGAGPPHGDLHQAEDQQSPASPYEPVQAVVLDFMPGRPWSELPVLARPSGATASPVGPLWHASGGDQFEKGAGSWSTGTTSHVASAPFRRATWLGIALALSRWLAAAIPCLRGPSLRGCGSWRWWLPRRDLIRAQGLVVDAVQQHYLRLGKGTSMFAKIDEGWTPEDL